MDINTIFKHHKKKLSKEINLLLENNSSPIYLPDIEESKELIKALKYFIRKFKPEEIEKINNDINTFLKGVDPYSNTPIPISSIKTILLGGD